MSRNTNAAASNQAKQAAATSAASKPDDKAQPTKELFVRSRPDQFYRAGIKFTKAGVHLPSNLSKAKLQAILDEPMLIVEERSVEAKAEK